MPIYPRGNKFLVSVGSKDNRYREAFDTLQAAQVAELEAMARQKASGSPLKRPTSDDRRVAKGVGAKTLLDAHDLTWRVRWCNDKGQDTHRVYCRAIFAEIPEETPLAEITYQMILEAVESWEEGGNGGQSVNHKVSHLSVMFDEAMKAGYVTAKPLMIRRKPGKHRIRWIDYPEEKKILDACVKLELWDLHDYIITAIDTGFRRGEMLGLIPRDYINGHLHLHDGETKSDKGRAVPVTERVSEIVRRRANFPKLFGLTERQLWKQWWDLKTCLGLESDDQFVVHCLRHTCASRLMAETGDIELVRQWMGHSSITTTMRYIHFKKDRLVEGKQALDKVNPTTTLRVVNG